MRVFHLWTAFALLTERQIESVHRYLMGGGGTLVARARSSSER
jgi:hypothetical protein